MKKYCLSFLFLFLYGYIAGQQRIIDSLKQLPPADNDTLKLVYSCLISLAYEEVNKDSAFAYGRNYLNLSQKLNYKLNEAEALSRMAYDVQGSANGLELIYEAQRIIQQNDDEKILPPKYLEMLHVPAVLHSRSKYKQHINGNIIFIRGIAYWISKKNDKALSNWSQTMEIGRSLPDSELLMLSYLAFGIIVKNNDSSLAYLKKSYQIAQETDHMEVGNIEGSLAAKYNYRKDYQTQLFYLKASLEHNTQYGLFIKTGNSLNGLANYYRKNVIKKDSAIFYGNKTFQTALLTNSLSLQYSASKFLFEMYKEEGNRDSTFKYLELMLNAKDKTSNEEKVREFETANFNHEMQQIALKSANEKFATKLKMYGLLTGLFAFVLLTIIFLRNSKRRKKEFILLQSQKAKTEQTLQELKFTQSQLIQSEKMASLGELTAGIAHEIQNPLNFVNNFSEVNTELIDEAGEEIDKGNISEAKILLNDIKENEQKIIFHGKRADAIVKGMLQHSRSSSGVKEPTDINALADEYLRLAYHGLRAKDKNFNATLKTEFGESIGNINIIPQDIGRVILNLITNAFYATNEKAKLDFDNYEPMVTVTTKRLGTPSGDGGKIEIRVADNGNGIPPKSLDKIFQPFFTTKPTGQGTGLGLSLSYDIVKAHGGELKVETREGEGAIFIIMLP